MRRLWHNGTIVSMDPEMTRYEAVGVEDGKIVFLGRTKDALEMPWDELSDLEGAAVLPGFNDSHMHMLRYAWTKKNLSLSGVTSMDELVETCRDYIQTKRPAYVLAQGWNHNTMAEGRLVTRQDLDRVSTEIPICALRVCMHVGACNTPMLERIKALKDIPQEILDQIDFEQGILRESSLHIYNQVIPPTTDQEVKELIQLAQRDLNAAGITCVHTDDLRIIAGMDPFHIIKLFREMEAEGELTIRVVEQCQLHIEELEEFLSLASAPEDRDSLFRTGPLKMLQDGALGARTAEMEGGYADSPGEFGIPIYTVDELFQYFLFAQKAHIDVAVHTIGDLALKKVCAAVERAERACPWSESRHGIVHAQTTPLPLLQKMKELRLQAYIQPIFINADMPIIVSRVGEEKAKWCYNWKTMLDMGIPISGGSDCPVEPFDILNNIAYAVTRKNSAGTQVCLPEQALTMEQAVGLFTAAGAWCSRDEAVRGTLELGKQADMVVLDQDIFTVEHDAIRDLSILETVVNGRTVYLKKAR